MKTSHVFGHVPSTTRKSVLNEHKWALGAKKRKNIRNLYLTKSCTCTGRKKRGVKELGSIVAQQNTSHHKFSYKMPQQATSINKVRWQELFYDESLTCIL
jgi:hypothetical protein